MKRAYYLIDSEEDHVENGNNTQRIEPRKELH